MVDYYRDWFSTQARPVLPEPPLPPLPYVPHLDGSRPNPSIGSDSVITEAEPAAPQELPEVSHLRHTLQDPQCTHAQAFAAYTTLPYPGVAYLSVRLRQLLFQRLAVIENKSRASMIHYLSVVEDMKNAGLPITQWQWNSAMSFAGRCFGAVSPKEVESAMDILREHGHKSSLSDQGRSVSLSILFDLSAKAGKFALAELILKEMRSRQLPLDRHARVGIIFYEGLRGNGQGVRRAYHDFVNSGEIVDTVVLNCVIASLLRAGEPAAAQQVYERMKRMHAQKTGSEEVPFLDWQATRDITAVLRTAAIEFKYQPEKLKTLQAEQSLAPNLRTFNIFLDYHIQETGSLTAVAALLDEMRILGVPKQSRTFVKLFRGFAQHGGVRYTFWTRARLESVWTALIHMLDLEDLEAVGGQKRKELARDLESGVTDGKDGHGQEASAKVEKAEDDEDVSSSADSYPRYQEKHFYLTKWLIIWAVRAYAKCHGQQRMREIWAELEKRWEPADEKESEAVVGVITDIEKRFKRQGHV